MQPPSPRLSRKFISFGSTNRLACFTTDGLAKITEESVMPIGLGRKIHNIPAFQDLLRHGSVNVLRPGLGLNSLTKIKRIAALAETHYVAVAPYHEGGPIGVM